MLYIERGKDVQKFKLLGEEIEYMAQVVELAFSAKIFALVKN